MKRQLTFLATTLFLLISLCNGQNVKDSCGIKIGAWFQPACRVDTCLNTSWLVAYDDKCINRVMYKIYNPSKTKVIYESDKTWSGRTGQSPPDQFYKTGYYPYEITFYTNDKKAITRKGKVYLRVW